MSDSTETSNMTITEDELKAVQRLFPSIEIDAKFTENIDKIQEFIWQTASTDKSSPSRNMAGMFLIVRRLHNSWTKSSDESAMLKAVYENLSETVKSKLQENTLDECLAILPAVDIKDSEQSQLEASAAGTAAGRIISHTKQTKPKRKREGEESITSDSSTYEASRRKLHRADGHDHSNQVSESLNQAQSSSIEATSKSASYLVIEKAMVTPISSVFDMKNGASYGDGLLAHFNAGAGNKSQQAIGFAYKLFLQMFTKDSLANLNNNWAVMAMSQTNSGNMDSSTNIIHRQLSANLDTFVSGMCKGFATAMQSETEGFKASMIFWNSLNTLQQHKDNFARSLEQYPTMAAKVEKINEQIRLLDIPGITLRTQSVGRDVKSHIDYLYNGIAASYRFNSTGRLRTRQTLLVQTMVKEFGKGVLGIMALEGYKTLAPNVQAERLPDIAKFVKEQTRVQILFDHINAWLVTPVLEGQEVEPYGQELLTDFLNDKNWSYLVDETI